MIIVLNIHHAGWETHTTAEVFKTHAGKPMSSLNLQAADREAFLVRLIVVVLHLINVLLQRLLLVV